jgi:hypothetical protein
MPIRANIPAAIDCARGTVKSVPVALQTVTLRCGARAISPAQALAAATNIVITLKIFMAFLPPPGQAEAKDRNCHEVINLFEKCDDASRIPGNHRFILKTAVS